MHHFKSIFSKFSLGKTPEPPSGRGIPPPTVSPLKRYMRLGNRQALGAGFRLPFWQLRKNTTETLQGTRYKTVKCNVKIQFLLFDLDV